MPSQIELSAEPRDVFGKHVRRLRRQGLIPANIYGHGASRAIQAPARALDRLLAHGGGTGIITIALDGQSQTALLKSVQRDPRSGHLLHVDFQAVSLQETVTSVVPIRFVGESPAVSRLGGVLTHPRTELHVTARAADLPDAIEVDVSAITELHGALHVSDLQSTAAYTIAEAGDTVLAMVQPPAIEREAEAAEVTPEAEAAATTEARAAEPDAGAES
jgi:large subunit ribosomal protein L25